MMTKQIFFAVAGVFLISQMNTPAQQKYVFNFAGTSSTTDSNGVIVTTPINNRTLLQEYAANHGVTDISYLGLAYHVAATTDFNGGAPSDTIEVINRTNGTFYATLFGLYFGEDPSLGRMDLLSGSHRQLKRLEYVYTEQGSHSLGSALITDYYFLDSNGNTNKTYIFGNMQYIVLPDATHKNVQICTGNLNTVAPWNFP